MNFIAPREEARRSPLGIVLEPPCPRSVDGISIDPEPNWNFASLLSEIESVEKKLNVFSKFPQPLTQTALRMGRRGGGFVMRVSEDEMESDVDEESEEEEEHRQLCTKGTRFACDDLYLSDESDDEFDCEPESFLLSKMGLAESALYEVINDHQTEVKEDIRSQVSVVETAMLQEIETSRSAIDRVEKYKEIRKEVERKLDLQYQRKVAEALDTHLTAIQREHEIKSQIEERKIRSEEARRRERAHQEEKIRQEKARAEAEMQAKQRAEEAKKEAERKAAKEAAEKELTDRKASEQRIAEEKAARERTSAASNAQAGGKSIQAAESALTLENHRLKKLEELEATNQSLRSRPNEDFSSFEKQITRAIKQIRGTKDNVSKKSNEIVKIFRDPRCPVSISIATFAKKIVSAKDHFAGSYVIVYVTSQFPQAMDIVLAEFHKACNYTVPKHILNSQSAWDSDAYEQLDSTMRLYGALVQNDIRGVTNIHGIDQGWAWLARFLNKTSATRATATALNAFLQMAGFGLHQRYRSQFLKVVNIVREHFLPRLRARKDASNLQTIITDITAYLDDQMYLKEPVGRTMQTNTLSAEITAEEVHQSNNQRYQGNNYYRDYY
ncbi:hypothetical protein IGI04_038671 [Brassica rapa subsp. trilocularis]|uniref:mRNA export factor GLE1 n=1 Tax=Brassica rapa subsp. trilocularis TaxID=1813537 RepID=A0ABQ7LPS2_BRACM|nr:hypothetical protein IGI04_038671 [Brassica rapa subsp. trilocularis]